MNPQLLNALLLTGLAFAVMRKAQYSLVYQLNVAVFVFISFWRGIWFIFHNDSDA